MVATASTHDRDACWLSPMLGGSEETKMRALAREELDRAGRAACAGEEGGRSRILRFGYTYTSPPKPIHRAWPSWLLALAKDVREHVYRSGWWTPPWAPFDAVTINEYPCGSELKPHYDINDFEREVVTLSLGGEGLFQLSMGSVREQEFLLAPGSVLVFPGDLLHTCKAIWSARRNRISIVFRRRREHAKEGG